MNAFSARNFVLPSGTAKIGETEYNVSLNSSPTVLAELNHLPIKSVNGAVIRVRDGAQVHDGYQPQQTVARYRQIVLAAFADVENNLAAENLLASQYMQVTDALQSANRQLEIANNRYEAGLVTYLEVAVAEHAALELERAGARLRGQQLVATVGLIKSLGGGWQEEMVEQ